MNYHQAMTTTGTFNASCPLAEVTVRRVTRHEVVRWQALVAEHHYLGFRDSLVSACIKWPSGQDMGSR